MRKLKVSILCAVAALLCCIVFALLFINLNGAQSENRTDTQTTADYIARPEINAQTTADTIIPGGLDTARCPSDSKYSNSYEYNNATYYKTVTVKYTGSPITVYVLASTINGPGGTGTMKAVSSGVTCSTSNCGITVPAASGTYYVDCTLPLGGLSTPSGTIYAKFPDGSTTMRITIIVETTTVAISPTVSYSSTMTYGGTQTLSVSGNTGGGNVTWTLTAGTGKATLSSTTAAKPVLTATQAGTVKVKASVAAKGNYLAGTTPEVTITINKANISPTLSYSSSVTYGRNSVAATVGGNPGGGTQSFSVAAGTGRATINTSNGVLSPTQAGTVNVTVSIGATTNYNGGSKTITVTIYKANIAPTLAYSTVTYGSNSAAPTVGGNSGNGTKSFSLAAGTGRASINPTTGVISPTQAGTVNVTVSIGATTNYNAGSKTITVTINKANIAPALSYSTVTYGANASPTVTNGGDGAKTFTVAAGTGNATINPTTGVLSPTQAGNVTVSLNIAAGTNYNGGSKTITVTINKASVTPNFTYTTVTYGAVSAAPAITGNAASTKPQWSVAPDTGEATINSSNGVLTPVQAGNVKVTLYLPGNTNYLEGSKTLTITINKAAISPDFTYATITYGTDAAAPAVTGNTANGKISFMIEAGTGAAVIDPDTGALSPTQAGSVTVILNVAATTNYASGTKRKAITINRCKVAEPEFDVSSSLNSEGLKFEGKLKASLVYTGAQVYISVNRADDWATGMNCVLAGSIDEASWTASNGAAFVVTSALALADTTHSVTYTLKNSNFVFEGGSDTVVLSLSITKQPVAVPSFDADDANNTAGLAFSNSDRSAIYEYSASQVYIAITNVENWSVYMSAELSAGVDASSWAASAGKAFLVSSTEARGGSTHTLTFTISGGNYIFENGQDSVTLTLAITKAKLDLPAFNSLDTQNPKGITFSDAYRNATLGYTGNDVRIGVSIIDDWTSYMESELSDGINGMSWVAAGGKAVTVDAANALAGTSYTLTFTISDDNYVFDNDATEVTLKFNITTKSVTDSDIIISLSSSSFVYNGLTQSPVVSLAHTGAISAPVKDTDFTVKFINGAGEETAEPTDAGAYTVVIAGIGNYTGESSAVKYTVTPEEITSTTITLSDTEYGFDGSAKTPEVEIKIGDTVISSTFYTVKYTDNVNAGTATVTIGGVINLSGETSLNYTINVRDISVVAFSPIDAQDYNGNAHTPTPSVTDSELGNILVIGRDFEFSYEDNTDAGTATITVTAKGNYGGTASTSFVINPRDITVVLIGAIESQSFDGTAKTPAPAITDYKIAKTLTEGVDFDFVYENNYDAGVATLYINGKNNYTGTYSFPFTINKRSLDNAEFLSIDAQTYDGNNKTPTANVTENGLTLRQGLDYSVSYTNNLNAGEATMTITGIGNYSGVKSFNFTIYAKALDGTFDIDGVNPSYAYTGKQIKPTVTLNWNGKTLSSALDYDVSYSDGVDAGTTVLVTVSGKGNYTGSRQVEFTIIKATPEVNPDYDRTESLHAGWGLPVITATVIFNGEEVTGALAWQKIDGEEPKLADGEKEYAWVFTPTGDAAVNFNAVTGTLSIYAEPVEIVSITIATSGEKKTYTAFDKFDNSTITVTATLNDGTEEVMSSGYDIIYTDGRDCLWASDTSVTVRCLSNGKEISGQFSDFAVVKAVPTVNPTVDGKPKTGNKLSSVSLTFAGGDTAGDYAWTNAEALLETGEHTYLFTFTPEDTVNYEVYDGTVTINIVVVTDMTVNFEQNGVELFTTDGLEELENLVENSTVYLTVKLLYSDNTSRTLSLNAEDGYTLEIAGSTLSEDGAVKVVYNDDGTPVERSFNAQVTLIKVVRIEAELNTDATVYTDTALENLKNSVTVTAYYNNDASKTVEDFNLSFIGGATKLTHGTAKISVDYAGDYKDDSCQPFELTVSNVVKHETVVSFQGKTVYTYTGEEQVIDSGAVLNHAQAADITYTVDGNAAAFTNVPAGGKITVTVSVGETEDYYPAQTEVVITVNKAQTVLDLSGVKRSYTYTGEEQRVDGATISQGEEGAEIVYSDNNSFISVPEGGKLAVTISVAESENYFGATETVEVTVEKAKIDVNDSGEKLYFTGDYLAISLDAKNADGTFKNILTYGEEVKISYSNAYKVGEEVAPEPQDEDELSYSAFKPELKGVGRYVINVRIASTDDYETYFGQWLVEVADGAVAPAATTVGEAEVPTWLITVFAVCAAASIIAVIVAAVSLVKKPSAADNDGFYDDATEEQLMA